MEPPRAASCPVSGWAEPVPGPAGPACGSSDGRDVGDAAAKVSTEARSEWAASGSQGRYASEMAMWRARRVMLTSSTLRRWAEVYWVIMKSTTSP